MTSLRSILHADMDAFYAAVEQRDRPELRGKPVIVGGTGDRGVVSAASYEARPSGVRSAMPMVVARQRCPDAFVIRGDMEKYRAESKKIFAIFRRFTPSVEGISLDEAFLDLTGGERLFGSPRLVGERLRREVREETQLAVSVGIAPVKMVAKIASGLAKPDGLLEVEAGQVRRFLDPLSVNRLWGVGPVAHARLRSSGLETIGDLARADGGSLQKVLGDWAFEIARLARGEDLREVTSYRDPISISEESTFENDVDNLDLLDEVIVIHSEAVARRLRKSGFCARTIVLKIKLAERVAPGPRGYPLLTRQKTLPDPTDDGEVLIRGAQDMLRKVGLSGAVRLVGIGVTNLISTVTGQPSLFENSPENSRRRELNRALDQLNERFGLSTVRRASARGVSRQGLSFQIKRGEFDEEVDVDENNEIS